jgi:hypothetical protein
MKYMTRHLRNYQTEAPKWPNREVDWSFKAAHEDLRITSMSLPWSAERPVYRSFLCSNSENPKPRIGEARFGSFGEHQSAFKNTHRMRPRGPKNKLTLPTVQLENRSRIGR